MKFYVEVLTEKGRAALQQHLDDTERLDTGEKVKGKAVVKHKVVDKEPLTVMMRPRKVTLMAARITPGLHKFVEDYKAEMVKTMRENGAQPGDYKLTVVGKR